MRRALQQRSQRFIIWLGLLPLILAFVSYRTSSSHIASVQATFSTDQFIRRLDELFSAVQDAETGQRGYLLTGDDQYLRPFASAQKRLPARVAEVEALAARNNVPAGKMRRIRALVEMKMAELEEVLDLVRAGGRAAALKEVETNRGDQYMSELRSAIDGIKSEQNRELEMRWEAQQRSQLRLDAVLGIGIVIGFLLLSLAYRFNVLYARERDEAEARIQRLNESLELRVQERTSNLEARTRELEQRTAELQRSNADLTQFAYIASHDLQEPLRMVGSYMGLLARRYQGQLDETADRYIQFATDGAARMQTLIADLLTYSRAGTQAIEKKPVPFEQVVTSAVRNLEIAIRENSAEIHYGNLPLVDGDESKLVQVMQNLIGNAIKFHKPGVTPVIEINAKHVDHEWLFSVADNGIGFEPRYCDRIFQVFQRLHSVGRYPGNGIGLAICRRIIEHHGGKLWADSEPEVGSTFFFTLPIATEDTSNQSHLSMGEGGEYPEPASHVGISATI